MIETGAILAEGAASTGVTVTRQKAISLTFRGFDAPLDSVTAWFKSSPHSMALQGTAVRPGRDVLFTRSFVAYSIYFSDDFPLREMIPALWKHLDGVDQICAARHAIRPDVLEIDVLLPILHSHETQGGAFTKETIAEVARIQATLGFGFF